MKNAQHTPKFCYAEIPGTPMPPEQTGAYLSYATDCDDGSDKVIRETARFYSRAVPTDAPLSSTSIG